jgi:nicotinamidase-related amidase
MFPYCLVIVDMQPQFRAARNDEVADIICDLIELAKKDDATILVLEYEGFGKTRDDIIDAIGDYTYFNSAQKYTDDGSKQITGFVGNEVPLKICGVNFGCCVRETALGATKRGYDVEVISEACYQPEDWEDEDENYKWNGVISDLQCNGIALS